MKRALIVSADTSLHDGIPANLGDAFLTESLADALRKRGYEPRAADFGATTSTKSTLRLPLSGARLSGLSRAIRDADVVLVGGGTLLQDDTPSGSAFGGLARLLAVTSTLARVHSRPLGYFGVGANPVTRPPQRALIRMALAGRRVYARDLWTQQLLRSSYSKRSSLAADTAMLAAASPMAHAEASNSIVLAGYPGDVADLDVHTVKALANQYERVEFLSMSQGKKSDASFLREEVREQLYACHENVTVEHAASVVQRSSAVLSSRMHALYLGLLNGKRLAALGDRHKVLSFGTEFRVSQIVQWSDALETPPAFGEPSAIAAAQDRANNQLDACLLKIK